MVLRAKLLTAEGRWSGGCGRGRLPLTFNTLCLVEHAHVLDSRWSGGSGTVAAITHPIYETLFFA